MLEHPNPSSSSTSSLFHRVRVCVYVFLLFLVYCSRSCSSFKFRSIHQHIDMHTHNTNTFKPKNQPASMIHASWTELNWTKPNEPKMIISEIKVPFFFSVHFHIRCVFMFAQLSKVYESLPSIVSLQSDCARTHVYACVCVCLCLCSWVCVCKIARMCACFTASITLSHKEAQTICVTVQCYNILFNSNVVRNLNRFNERVDSKTDTRTHTWIV